MLNRHFFPVLLLVIQSAASGVYFYNGDWRRGLYWLFADGITAVVTF